MTVLVTGAAGFIGFSVARALLERGERVVGVDNLNAYYGVALKRDRLAEIAQHSRFSFHALDIADFEALCAATADLKIDRVVHMAAQAGVRHSLDHPFAYARANLDGHLAVLELCRRLPALRHLVYASSSSVYGGNTKVPFAEGDRVDHPVSLYAATKKADELMSHAYAHLYGIIQTGLRFFTVYGPWGRPDMAMWQFTAAVLEGRPVRVFNHGEMSRDFTFIDDAVAGVLAALDRPPSAAEGQAPHRIYNIGNSRPERLLDALAAIEHAIGRRAWRIMEPMQPGDVPATWADIAAARRDLGYAPDTPLSVGVPSFVAWFRSYHGC